MPRQVRRAAKGGYAVQLSKGKISQVFGDEYPEWRKATKESDLSRTYKRTHGPE